MQHALLARVLCALAYPPLAYWAARSGSGMLASLALGDLALMVLVGPLLQPRAWAWAVALGVAAGLYLLGGGALSQLLLPALPVLVLALVAWWFGRSLWAPRQALITRIVAALHATPAEQLPDDLLRYTRRLTAAWALLLGVLALVNAVLLLVEVPGGVLAQLGHAPAWAVSRAHAALLAGVLNYGVVGGFFVGEYLLRGRWFKQRPYRNFLDFLLRMGRLGPAFWKDFLR